MRKAAYFTSSKGREKSRTRKPLLKASKEPSMNSEAYLEPGKRSMMDLFENIFNRFQPPTISANSSSIDLHLGSKYNSRIYPEMILKT